MPKLAKPTTIRKSKPPKPPKPPKAARRRGRPEAVWETPDGYRIVDSLLAGAPGRPGSDAVQAFAAEVVDTHVRLGRRGLAVCGAAVGAGVSFVAASLAVGLAQAGVSTLIVDANLEAPSLQDLIKPPTDLPGLWDLLDDDGMDLLDAVHAQVMPNLSVLYAGAVAPDAEDRLGTDRFQGVVQRCLRHFECTIFDTPPANRSTGARTVALAAGYALLVARRGASYADDLEQLADQLAQDGTLVVGSVLNRAG
ncbi:hypothetical protein [Phenylobacterium sp.]|uniref:hypothetical protein n=1 Tax=Phenylobacterium sp. TaxID=1871053 RepID=UPI002EDB53C4